MEKYKEIIEETYYEIWDTFHCASNDVWIETTTKKILIELIETIEKKGSFCGY